MNRRGTSLSVNRHVIKPSRNKQDVSPCTGVYLESKKTRGSVPACGVGIFPGSSHTTDLKIGTPVATLPGAWRYRVSMGLVGPVPVYCDWVR